MGEKREWGRLNFVPRSNPHPNLHEVKQFLSCQQPITIFVRINMTHFMRGSRNFRQGGGGPGQSDKKQLRRFFLFFFSPQLILEKSKGQFQRNLSFSRFQKGSQIFQGGGGPTLSRGGPLIPYRNPYNL